MTNFFLQPDNVAWLLFSFKGRTNRTQFWVSHAYMFVLFFILLFGPLMLSDWLDPNYDNGISGVIDIAAMTLIILFYLFIPAAVWTKRLHDLGLPGSTAFVTFYLPGIMVRLGNNLLAGTAVGTTVSIFGAVAGLACLFFCGMRSGEPEPNEYGVSGDPDGALAPVQDRLIGSGNRVPPPES